MKLIIIITIFLILCGNLKSQVKEYDMLLCISYHEPNHNPYIWGNRSVLPAKRFNRITPKNVDNYIYETMLSKYTNINQDILSGPYFLFYSSELKLNDLYLTGIIHFPFLSFLPDSNYIHPKYLYNSDPRSIDSYCNNFDFYFNKNVFAKQNILGLHFSMNMFNTEFYDLFPFEPISITSIPVKIYAEIQKCTTATLNIPNWNRHFSTDCMALIVDSVPIYKINKFDSIVFYNNKKIISNKNKKYTIVNSNNLFMENIKYYKILNRKYLKKGKYNKNNSIVFKTDEKMSYYYNIK